jgi:hypothetical protein
MMVRLCLQIIPRSDAYSLAIQDLNMFVTEMQGAVRTDNAKRYEDRFMAIIR